MCTRNFYLNSITPKWATKGNRNSDQALERKSIDFGQEPVFLTTPARVPDYTSLSDKTSDDLSPSSGDKSSPQCPSSALRQQSAAVPKKQATEGAPHERAKQAMEQALERWVDGDRSGGPVKAFIAEHDRATRQGADGRKLIAEVVDRVVNRRGEASAAAMRGFIAEMDRQRKRAQGIGR